MRTIASLLLLLLFLPGAAAPQSEPAKSFLGFDRNDYPGDEAMKLLRKEFAFTSYWLGNPPQTKSNSWSGKREFLQVFDAFILQTASLADSEILEFGASQVLLLAGFFRDQMQRRHNVTWYDQIGQSLYEKAGRHSKNLKKRELFDGLSESFPTWTIVCRDLSRSLRENRFLLKVN